MKIIRGDRRSGKTTELIKKSHDEWKYIVCRDRQRVKFIESYAREMNIDIPFPIEIRELPLKSNFIKSVLIDDIEKTLKELLIEISNENNIKIIEMETNLDHIHILIECSPQHFIPNILKIFKGISARKLFLKHPEIKNKLWGGHLWNPSYFVATVSENTEEQIKRYIQTQKER